MEVTRVAFLKLCLNSYFLFLQPQILLVDTHFMVMQNLCSKSSLEKATHLQVRQLRG